MAFESSAMAFGSSAMAFESFAMAFELSAGGGEQGAYRQRLALPLTKGG
jgi:hypothetical protein